MRDGLVYRGLLKNHSDDDADPDRFNDDYYPDNNRKQENDSSWPHRSRYMILVLDDHNDMSTDPATQPPSVLPAYMANKLSDTVDPASWKRVWHLNDVENIYDVGFWTALADVWRGWDCRIGAGDQG